MSKIYHKTSVYVYMCVKAMANSGKYTSSLIMELPYTEPAVEEYQEPTVNLMAANNIQ
jgi:hypothetical protein